MNKTYQFVLLAITMISVMLMAGCSNKGDLGNDDVIGESGGSIEITSEQASQEGPDTVNQEIDAIIVPDDEEIEIGEMI